MRKPKQDMLWVALAGPVTNILQALGWAVVLRVLLGLDAEFVVTQHLQIHEPVAQSGKRQPQKSEEQQRAADLLLVGHPKNGQPPVAIGSSTNGVTSGGQNFLLLTA